MLENQYKYSMKRKEIKILAIAATFLFFLVTAHFLSYYRIKFDLPGIFAASSIVINQNSGIIVPDDWSEANDSIAAKDLRIFLNKTLETAIPLESIVKEENSNKINGTKIYLGGCSANTYLSGDLSLIKNDGYIIDIKDDNSVHIAGKTTEKGNNNLTTQFAVYGFLEKYIGFRWFLPEVFAKDENDIDFPDNMGTYVPPIKSEISLNVEKYKQDPSFKYRMVSLTRKWNVENGINTKNSAEGDDADQIYKNMFKVNQLAHTFLDFVPPYQTCKGREKDVEYIPKCPAETGDYCYAEVNGTRKSCKNIIDYGNVEIREEGLKLSEICDGYFDSETYIPSVLVKGKANTKSCFQLMKEVDQYFKLNDGNLQVRQMMAENLRDYIKANPNNDVIILFPEDGSGFDESSVSTDIDGENYGGYTVKDVNNVEGDGLKYSYNYSPEMLRILSKRMTIVYKNVLYRLNKLAESDSQLRELLNKKIIMNGAYNVYKLAPLEDSFVGHFDENVGLLMAHSWEQNSPINSRVSEENQNFDDAVKRWKEKWYSRFGAYEYYKKGSMYDLPFPIVHSIKEDIPYYAENDFILFYTQASNNLVGVSGHLFYLTSKLLQNSNANTDEIMNDFYEKFYGPANEKMKVYYEKLENTAINSGLELSPPLRYFLRLFAENIILDCKQKIAEAKTAVNNSSESESNKKLYLARISLVEKSMEYTGLTMDYLEKVKEIIDTKLATYENKIYDGTAMTLSDSDKNSLDALAADVKNKRDGIYSKYKVVGGDKTYTDNLFDSQYVFKNT